MPVFTLGHDTEPCLFFVLFFLVWQQGASVIAQVSRFARSFLKTKKWLHIKHAVNIWEKKHFDLNTAKDMNSCNSWKYTQNLTRQQVTQRARSSKQVHKRHCTHKLMMKLCAMIERMSRIWPQFTEYTFSLADLIEYVHCTYIFVLVG